MGKLILLCKSKTSISVEDCDAMCTNRGKIAFVEV